MLLWIEQAITGSTQHNNKAIVIDLKHAPV